MFKKILLFFFVFLLFAVRCPLSAVSAEGEFTVDSNVEYKVTSSGITHVTHSIILENVLSDLYATSYKLQLENIKADNIRSFDDKGNFDTQTDMVGDAIIIKVNFSDPLVGKGKQRHFKIAYDASSLAQKTGEVWEISVPRLSDDSSYRDYSVTLLVPDGFKSEAYLSPQPIKRGYQDGFKTFYFSKDSVSKTGITAGFGDFQVFSFSLIYHLENPLSKSMAVDIAIPPDTSLQKVNYEIINPEPKDVTIDEDGNWIATFFLKSRERMDVTAKGTVQIFSGPRQFSKPSDETLNKNLMSTEFWQVDDEQIQKLALTYNTPKKIYDYVSSSLKYDYDRVKPNVIRLGAKKALESPNSAICMEFTDLFIAIARAAGIPAREINGYAYTDNKEIQPLSLVADVLHSWPEYWNKETSTWIPIDPTWASTTGGVDFFYKLDLRHFTFVIHGTDPIKPYPPGSYKLGTNPQKDVFVNFGSLPARRFSKITLSYKKDRFIPFQSQKVLLKVRNDGTQSGYNSNIKIYFDDILNNEVSVGTIPPFAVREIKIAIPFSFLGTNTPKEIRVAGGDENLIIPTSKSEVIISNLVLLFLVFALITLFILKKLGKINFNKIVRLIKKVQEKLTLTNKIINT